MLKVRCLLVVFYFIVLVYSAPLTENESEAKILNNEYTIDEKGNYKFSFKTSNGITREETGSILNEGQPNQYLLVVGYYTYLNPEGKEEIVHYIAGENGFDISPPEGASFGAPPQLVASLLGK